MTQYSFNKSYAYTSTLDGKPNGSVSGTVVERIMDTRSPLVRNKLTKGWRQPSAYNRTIEEGDSYTVYTVRNEKHNSANLTFQGSGADDCGGFWYEPMPVRPFYMEGAAITKALLQLKGQNENFSQLFAERRQTAGLVENTCVRLWKMVRNVRRTAAHLGTDPFNLWLEIQYGWKPLLMDVHGSVTDLMGKADRPLKFVAVGTAHDKFAYTKHLVASKGYGQLGFDKQVRGRTDVRVRLDYEQNDNTALRAMAQLGLTNPLDLLWEELPFSFVVDWFVPIGDYFNCLDATIGWQFKGGTCSTMQRMNYRAVNPKVEHPGYHANGTNTVEGKASHRKLVRDTYSTSPLPTVPFFNDKSSSLHVANGISLLGSAFTNSKRIYHL